MKKILFFFLSIISIFTLISCKKNEPVGRVSSDFLSDFTFQTQSEFEKYEAIIEEEKVNNRLGRKYKVGNMTTIDFTPNKKVSIKTISFRVYNYSETDTFNIFVMDSDSYWMPEKDVCYINYLGGDFDYHIEEIKPGAYRDITINLGGLVIKKNVSIITYFGINFNTEIQGFDINEEGVMQKMFNIMKNSAGVCNFKVEYSAYMKI